MKSTEHLSSASEESVHGTDSEFQPSDVELDTDETCLSSTSENVSPEHSEDSLEQSSEDREELGDHVCSLNPLSVL